MGEQETNYFSNLLEHLDYSVADHRLLYDEEGNAVNYEFLYVNDAFCRSLRMEKERILGRTVKELIPSIEEVWLERYQRVVETQQANKFIMYTEALDAYFSVHAFPTGKDTFATSFVNLGTNTPKKVTDEFLQHQNTVGFLEYNRIMKHILSTNNLPELIGTDFKNYDDYRLFALENVHPEDREKLDQLNRVPPNPSQFRVLCLSFPIRKLFYYAGLCILN